MSQPESSSSAEWVETFGSVPLEITVRAGRARRTLQELLHLERGDVVELDRKIGETFDLLVEGLHVASVTPVACEDQVAIKLVRIEENDR